MNGSTRRRRAAGFSLLEVIAALVILSAGAAASLTWLVQSVSTMARLRTQERVQLVRMDVLDYLRALNPQARPEGAVQRADYSFSWKSRRLREPVAALNELRAGGNHEVTLYEVIAQVSPSPGEAGLDFTIVLPVAGFRRLADPGPGDARDSGATGDAGPLPAEGP